MSELISRKCPLCKSDSYTVLLEVPNESFIDINEGLLKDIIEQEGLDKLEDIEIVECNNCEFTYTLKHLDDELMGRLYGEIIDITHSEAKIYRNSKRLRYIQLWSDIASYYLSQNVDASSEIEVLEFGAGWGDFLRIARGPGINVAAIEYDERKRKVLNDNGIENFKEYKALENDKKYNIFFSNAVFEHVVDPKETMKYLDDYLAEDVVGYIAVPNYRKERLMKSLNAIKDGNAFDKSISTWEHVNYFSPKKLWDMLDELGFKIIDIKTGEGLSRDECSTEVFFVRK
jgi:2-polyprenyl-3-methyl-5-hydroxy-6-metoxy-1,4-benzoquinol methylase